MQKMSLTETLNLESLIRLIKIWYQNIFYGLQCWIYWEKEEVESGDFGPETKTST